MARLLRFSSRRRIGAEASEWLSRIDRGLQDSEKAELEHWLALDPRHAEMLLNMAALWDDMERLHELSGLFPLPAARKRRRPQRRWVGTGAVAVASLVVAAIGIQLILATDDPASDATIAVEDAQDSTHDGILTTVVGDQQVESLPDGSVVQLNTNSRLEILFSATERRVAVHRGEAHFEVRHDPARPFVVEAAGRRIVAIGTAFNVYLRDESRVEVLVTEGRVLISRPTAELIGDTEASTHPAEALRLGAGELATLEPSRHLIRPISLEERSSRLAWQRGMLIFNGEALEAALEEVARYTDIRFAILDDDLRHVRIGGFYKAGDVAGLVRSLEQNFPVRITHDESRQLVELRLR